MKKTEITFEEWIDDQGVEVVAKAVGVSNATVRNWRRWFCDPELSQVRKIKKVSGGVLTYDQIIDRRAGARS